MQRGLAGEFGLVASPWREAGEPFRITTTWNTNDSSDMVQAGWRAPPGFSPLVACPDLFVGTLERGKRTYPAVCRAGRAIHTLDMILPSGIVPDRLPAAIETSAPDFAYREEWSGVGNHLRVRTEITSSCQNRMVTPEQIDAVRAAFGSIEGKINPLLHFNRIDVAKTPPSSEGRNLAATPGRKIEQ